MKQSIAILLAAALLTLLLCGCGEMTTQPPAVSATPLPEITPIPESMMPNPEDGVVKDGDGIIEPNDSGTGATSGSVTSGATGGTTSGTVKGAGAVSKSAAKR